MDMKNTSVNAGEDFYYYIKREYTLRYDTYCR